MAQEADRYWSQIANDGYCFNRKELAQQYLESFQTPSDVLETFEKLQHSHQKVSVKMFGAGAGDEILAASQSEQLVGNALSSVRVTGATARDKLTLLGQCGSNYYGTDTICRISK